MKLYRFERVDAKRLKAIEDGCLWYSSPETFNDLADCRPEIVQPPEGIFGRARVLAAIEVLYADLDESQHPLRGNALEFLRLVFDESGKDDGMTDLDKSRRKDYILRKVRQQIIRRTAVCCFFATGPTDQRMWAHYADQHKGFCVEYDVIESAEHLQELREVTYVTALPKIGWDELIFCPNASVDRIVSTKFSEWSYETEVRLVRLNELNPPERGKLIPRPDWLVPTRIIRGSRQPGGEVGQQVESLAAQMKLPLATAAVRPGGPAKLTIQNA